MVKQSEHQINSSVHLFFKMGVGLQLMCYKKDKQKARGSLYLSYHTTERSPLNE